MGLRLSAEGNLRTVSTISGEAGNEQIFLTILPSKFAVSGNLTQRSTAPCEESVSFVTVGIVNPASVILFDDPRSADNETVDSTLFLPAACTSSLASALVGLFRHGSYPLTNPDSRPS
jgi:hypothetical protein